MTLNKNMTLIVNMTLIAETTVVAIDFFYPLQGADVYSFSADFEIKSREI